MEQRRYYTIELPRDLIGGEAARQIDVILKRKNRSPSDTKHNWRDIEVIGELKASEHSVKCPLVQLARYARDVFAYQPTRRYLHGFTISGSTMTVWIFDRSGCYSPATFDIHKEPELFIRVIAGYTMMNEEELGLDTFMRIDRDRHFIRVEHEEDEVELQLEPTPLTRQRAIVCRGTACYLAKFSDSDEWSHVAKFSWTSGQRKSEADFLERANQRGVEGISKLVGYRTITSISEMRSGLTFAEPYTFRSAPSNPLSPVSQPQGSGLSSDRSRPLSSLDSLTFAGSSERLRKRKSGGVGSKSKRSRSNRQRSGQWHSEVTYDVESERGTSLYETNDGSYDNRIFRCLVIFPAGRPIHQYQSLLELLEALRDAIKAHQSLYSKGKILHRDISENNIIITDRHKTGHSGMLIDLDLAKELGSAPSGARCRTGTLEFMAIEVLVNRDHSYRHDLESFLYVLLWQCGRRGWEFVNRVNERPRKPESVFTEWYCGPFQRIARSKRGQMDLKGFDDVLFEFPREFERVKPLQEIPVDPFPSKRWCDIHWDAKGPQHFVWADSRGF
ncbi:hypothetical protein VTN31DRAFT_1157 [Thermomyces dupontii]|uniref:uncharacterized protein n=1 Tax=Talaromyces thermophilus TaxID=28565 RepID=UPI003742C253